MTAPALITAQEYLVRIGDPLSELGRQLLATLLHYEAEVGRLTEKLREAEMRVFKFEEGEFVRVLKLEAQLARSAPFAALGRRCASDYRDGCWYVGSWPEAVAARAALSGEAEPGWSEPAPSGCRYQMRDGKLWRQIEGGEEYVVVMVSLPDIAFVAKLMESKGVTP